MKHLQLSYLERSRLCSNPTSKKLLELMESKKTNLCFNADVTTQNELLHLADMIGPYICILKTHVDILEDFTEAFAHKLQEIAARHQFLIFEDRKFADIGHTVSLQYSKGIYKIADWSDITNAHTVPGPGIIEGLKKVGLPKGRALLLLAEMSSAGTLAHGSYTDSTLKMADEHPDFVVGFISMRKISSDPRHLHLTPGVKKEVGKDSLGQQYKTPHSVIYDKLSDIIIVGRGIYESADPVKEAKDYQRLGWDAYKQRLSST